MKTALYIAKEPCDAVFAELVHLSTQCKVTVVCAEEAYIDFYAHKGYNAISSDNFFNLSDMNFSATLGNPPYLGTTHLKFLLKALELSDYVSLVHPAGWLYREGQSIEQNVKAALKGRVSKLKFFNGNHTFAPAQFAAPLVVTTAVKEHTGPIEVQYDFSEKTYYIDSLEDLPTGFWEPKAEHFTLVSKVKAQAVSSNLLQLKDKSTSQPHFLRVPSIHGDGRAKERSKMCRDDFWTFFYDKSDMYTHKEGASCFVVNSEDEVESLRSYLKTDYARFALSINKVTQHIYINRYLEVVPLPELNRVWDNDSVYRYFGVSTEEVELINSYIPQYNS